jgi:thioredoxin 1
MPITEITSLEQLDTYLSGKHKYVFIDFSATFCGPCKTIYPYIKEKSKEYSHIKFLKIDADKQPAFIKKYSIKAFPTFILFEITGTQQTQYNPVVGANKEKIDNLLEMTKITLDENEDF